PARTKLVAFVISSVIVGMLGAIEAHRFGSVNPDATFSVHTTVLALVTPIFGGLYTTVGPILAALVLSGVEETLKRTLSDGYLVAYGVVLVVSILFMPRGLVGLFRGLTRRGRERARADAPRADARGGRDACAGPQGREARPQLRRPGGRPGPLVRRGGRRDLRDHRAQRRRQDDDPEPALRPARAQLGPRVPGRRRRHAAAHLPSLPPGLGPRLPGRAAVPRDDGRGEPDGRRPLRRAGRVGLRGRPPRRERPRAHGARAPARHARRGPEPAPGEAPRDRPRPGHEPEGPAPRRGDGRPQARRGAAGRRAGQERARRRRHGRVHRARDARRARPRRPRARHGLRPRARPRQLRRGDLEPARDRGLPRRGARRLRPRRGRWERRRGMSRVLDIAGVRAGYGKITVLW